MAYDMRYSDWSSDGCSADLFAQVAGDQHVHRPGGAGKAQITLDHQQWIATGTGDLAALLGASDMHRQCTVPQRARADQAAGRFGDLPVPAGEDLLEARIAERTHQADAEIGRASCRERVCQYV